MEELKLVFQADSYEVNQYYDNHPNYLIDYTTALDNTEFKYCILYFSSHDIYYPNSAEAFHSKLVAKNRFEWFGTRINKGSKHIFLRDIKKQWYLTGINKELNSIEKVLEYLKSETKGYRIITIGSSAGGYAAVLFGQLLNAETIFSFNGQFMLSDLLFSSNEKLNPIIFREQSNPHINQYYSLIKHITHPQNIFYFFSNGSTWDLMQFNHIKKLKINCYSFKTKHHGIPFLKIALPKVLNLSKLDLLKLGHKLSSIRFSIQMVGYINCAVFIVKKLFELTVYRIGKIKYKKI